MSMFYLKNRKPVCEVQLSLMASTSEQESSEGGLCNAGVPM